jgi:UTP--glucose-1-phosphate uridylyltransferase
MGSLRKVIIPAAGLGKRLLPVTIVIPKELLPVGREPMLLRALREVREAGLDEIAIVVGGRNNLIEKFLSGSPPPEIADVEEVEDVLRVLSELKITLIEQPEARGLGDALGRAREFVGDEPFAVILPDNFFFGSPGPLSQLIPVYEKHDMNITGLIRVTRKEAPSFGNCGSVRVESIGNGEYRIAGLGDKAPGFFSMKDGEEALRWYARHIFLSSFFEHLDRFGMEKNNEIDDVPVLKAMIAEEGIIGKLLDGRGFDVGNERGLIAAQGFIWEEVSSTWK